jgi:hypothetical protein
MEMSLFEIGEGGSLRVYIYNYIYIKKSIKNIIGMRNFCKSTMFLLTQNSHSTLND